MFILININLNMKSLAINLTQFFFKYMTYPRLSNWLHIFKVWMIYQQTEV